jgi:hypothetical protein
MVVARVLQFAPMTLRSTQDADRSRPGKKERDHDDWERKRQD